MLYRCVMLFGRGWTSSCVAWECRHGPGLPKPEGRSQEKFRIYFVDRFNLQGPVGCPAFSALMCEYLWCHRRAEHRWCIPVAIDVRWSTCRSQAGSFFLLVWGGASLDTPLPEQICPPSPAPVSASGQWHAARALVP